MDTEQFNVRLSKSLLEDLEFVSRMSKVSKSEWMKVKLGELVRKEKDVLFEQLEKSFIRGSVSIEEFTERAGEPSKELKERRNAYHKKMITMIQDKNASFAKSALDLLSNP